MSEPRTAAGRALLAQAPDIILWSTEGKKTWVTVRDRALRDAILAIEAEAAAPDAERRVVAAARAWREARRIRDLWLSGGRTTETGHRRLREAADALAEAVDALPEEWS